MSNTTKIEWADSTFNPWIGCTKVSTAASGGGGCDGCYAEGSTPARVLRAKGQETWGPGAARQRTSAVTWKLPLTWNAQPFVECMGCRWRGEARAARRGENPAGFYPAIASTLLCPCCSEPLLKEARRRVFCASLADVFDNEVDAAWRADLFALITKTPRLDWLLLTKRIGNAARMIEEARGQDPAANGKPWPFPQEPRGPLANVRIGITVVNREEMLRDGPKLKALHVPDFWSYEPALGGLGLIPHGLMPGWVIAGGESGAQARPANPEWFRSLRDQCAEAEAPYLFKQWGEWAPYPQDMTPEQRRAPTQRFNLDERWEIWRCGKKVAGRLLDGVEHNGFPEARHA